MLPLINKPTYVTSYIALIGNIFPNVFYNEHKNGNVVWDIRDHHQVDSYYISHHTCICFIINDVLVFLKSSIV